MTEHWNLNILQFKISLYYIERKKFLEERKIEKNNWSVLSVNKIIEEQNWNISNQFRYLFCIHSRKIIPSKKKPKPKNPFRGKQKVIPLIELFTLYLGHGFPKQAGIP